MKPIHCQQCQTEMQATNRAEHNYALQVLGVLLFFFGLWCFTLLPLGPIVGLVLIILAARLGYSKKPVWLCPHCGYFFERAK